MKDLIEKILVYLPQYLTDLGRLLIAPYSFISARNANTEENFRQALLFFVLSICLVVIIATPANPPGVDIWQYLARVTIANVLTIFLFAGLYRIAWWIVGGQAPFRSFAITFSYTAGLASVVIAVCDLVARLAKAGVSEKNLPTLCAQVWLPLAH